MEQIRTKCGEFLSAAAYVHHLQKQNIEAEKKAEDNIYHIIETFSSPFCSKACFSFQMRKARTLKVVRAEARDSAHGRLMAQRKLHFNFIYGRITFSFSCLSGFQTTL